MLVKKEPVTHIRINRKGKVEVKHFSDRERKPCIYCKRLTKKRVLGLPECKECIKYGYEKCSECKYGFRASEFHCDGNDLNDHFIHYTACAMRDYMGDLRSKTNFKESPSAWYVSPLERKVCFKKKKRRIRKSKRLN
jgi:hypothetical protein